RTTAASRAGIGAAAASHVARVAVRGRGAAARVAAALLRAAIHRPHLGASLLGLPAELLARLRRCRVAPLVVLLRGPGVAIRRALAMLGVVVEVAVADVRLVEVVVVVDVDVHVVVAPADVAPDRRADDDARGEREAGTVRVA